jgi:hypothetical protein
MPTAFLPLCLYLVARFARPHGIAFIDSTPLPVCHNKRIGWHKVFTDLAERGRSSLGWFFGFKLHLIVDDPGESLAVCLMPGNVQDRKPVPRLAKKLWGKLCGIVATYPNTCLNTLQTRSTTHHPDPQEYAQSVDAFDR